jgi:hypothetical protein
MSSKNAAAVALVILLGVGIFFLGVLVSALYTAGVLIITIGAAGAAVLVGEYLIRYFGSRRPPA